MNENISKIKIPVTTLKNVLAVNNFCMKRDDKFTHNLDEFRSINISFSDSEAFKASATNRHILAIAYTNVMGEGEVAFQLKKEYHKDLIKFLPTKTEDDQLIEIIVDNNKVLFKLERENTTLSITFDISSSNFHNLDRALKGFKNNSETLNTATNLTPEFISHVMKIPNKQSKNIAVSTMMDDKKNTYTMAELSTDDIKWEIVEIL